MKIIFSEVFWSLLSWAKGRKIWERLDCDCDCFLMPAGLLRRIVTWLVGYQPTNLRNSDFSFCLRFTEYGQRPTYSRCFVVFPCTIAMAWQCYQACNYDNNKTLGVTSCFSLYIAIAMVSGSLKWAKNRYNGLCQQQTTLTYMQPRCTAIRCHHWVFSVFSNNRRKYN